MSGRARWLTAMAAFLVAGGAWAEPAPQGIWARPGYRLSVAGQFDFPPRFLARDDAGGVYISNPQAGTITRCVDPGGAGTLSRRTTFVRGRPTVHGMRWHEGWLWFTQTGAIYKARDRDGNGEAEEVVTVIPEGALPKGGGHWFRSITIHKGRLYTSIGDSGNASDETATERQKIWSFDLAGHDRKLFCGGLRNTEKLVVRPGTDEIWGMDHGSDWYGRPYGDTEGMQPITDLNPPCEMNHYVEGAFYGHPFIVGSRLPRPEFTDRKDIVELAARTTPPEWKTGAHWAPNAMAFYDGRQFPPEVRGDAFVAYHGSWNRSAPAGYQVARVLFEGGHPYGELPYVKFLPPKGDALGRPVDVLVARDGTLLISDDAGRRVYRLRYTGAGGGPR